MNWPTTALFVAARMTAPDGRCKTLDAAADGYVRAEACVCIGLRCGVACACAHSLLCRSAAGLDTLQTQGRYYRQPAYPRRYGAPGHRCAWQCCEPGRPVQQPYGAQRALPAAGVPRSAHALHRTASPSAAHLEPFQEAQVMWAAFRESCLEPGLAASLELHGTGTALGDPIELGALAAVQGARGPGTRPGAAACCKLPGRVAAECGILVLHGNYSTLHDRVQPVLGAFPLELAAAKSHGGHAETGAGAVGLDAAVARLQTMQQQPIAHLRAMNAHVCEALDSSAATLWAAPRSAAPAAAGDIISGISAFAFQGTNAHAVLCSTSAAMRRAGADKHPQLGHTQQVHPCALLHLPSR